MDPNDHRMIAKRMDLFHLQEEGLGMVFWHPAGFALYEVIESFIRRQMRAAGFQEIRTPQLLDRGLWEASGHWDKFGENMFALDDGERVLALKPMSCPAHVQIFNHRPRSFRELPMRLCEFGSCLRNEPSGALLGLMRTRAFVQDDAHIFCLPEQIEAEVRNFCAMLAEIYRAFGFSDVEVRFANRPKQRAGSDEAWDMAEARLERAALAAGLDFETSSGEGAFYGPKLEFHLRDNRGRRWQCGTVQLDMVLPERLGAEYVDAADRRQRPVMLHHAVLGSVERFIGVLLEHHAGKLPLWLAPVQVVVASVGGQQADYVSSVVDRLSRLGYRVRADVRDERLSRKVVDARGIGAPVFLTVGKNEMQADTVALRESDGSQTSLSVEGLDDHLRPNAFRESSGVASRPVVMGHGWRPVSDSRGIPGV